MRQIAFRSPSTTRRPAKLNLLRSGFFCGAHFIHSSYHLPTKKNSQPPIPHIYLCQVRSGGTSCQCPPMPHGQPSLPLTRRRKHRANLFCTQYSCYLVEVSFNLFLDLNFSSFLTRHILRCSDTRASQNVQLGRRWWMVLLATGTFFLSWQKCPIFP